MKRIMKYEKVVYWNYPNMHRFICQNRGETKNIYFADDIGWWECFKLKNTFCISWKHWEILKVSLKSALYTKFVIFWELEKSIYGMVEKRARGEDSLESWKVINPKHPYLCDTQVFVSERGPAPQLSGLEPHIAFSWIIPHIFTGLSSRPLSC